MGRLQGPLVLASGSPQRRKLLKRLRIPFTIVPSRVSERSAEKNPRKLVRLLAARKALSVAKKHPEAVVLGSDTLVYCRGEILGKPKNLKDAFRILKLLNGTWQRVYTGVAVVAAGKIYSDVAVSKVLARRLSDDELLRLAGKHMDKAGAYAVQDRSDAFIRRTVGDLDNVIGLPLRSVRKVLRRSESGVRPRRER